MGRPVSDLMTRPHCPPRSTQHQQLILCPWCLQSRSHLESVGDKAPVQCPPTAEGDHLAQDLVDVPRIWALPFFRHPARKRGQLLNASIRLRPGIRREE